MKRLALVAGALALLAAGACAHDWYDPWCCNGKDCVPIPDGTVHPSRGGYRVKLCPGDHPGITGDCLFQTVRHSETRPSQDGRYHACIFPTNTLRCLYAPLGGV